MAVTLHGLTLFGLYYILEEVGNFSFYQLRMTWTSVALNILLAGFDVIVVLVQVQCSHPFKNIRVVKD